MNSKDWVLRHHHERTVERWRKQMDNLADDLRRAYAAEATLKWDIACLRCENLRLMSELEDMKAEAQEASE